MEYPPQPPNSKSCGAYAMAYYLKEKNKDPLDVQRIVSTHYPAIQFQADDFKKDEIPGWLVEYSNPARIMQVLRTEYHTDSIFHMNKSGGIYNLYTLMKITDDYIRTHIDDECPFSSETLAENQSALEIVGSGSDLHYLYVYKQNGTAMAIDPADGEKHGRSSLMQKEQYEETGAAIVIGQAAE